MSALTLLVDAANAESESPAQVASSPAGLPDPAAEAVPSASGVTPISVARAAMAKAMAAAAGAASHPGLPGGAVVLPGAANHFVASALQARETAMVQQQMQQQGAALAAAAKNRYLEEQHHLSKEHAMMLHREKEQEAAMHQATLLRLMGGAAGGPSPAPAALPGMHPHQEAEYLQQLRLEALVQQRRQDTLAKLALAQEIAYPNSSGSSDHGVSPSARGNLSPPPPERLPLSLRSKESITKFKRQDTALQKAILMARADEELKKQEQERQQQQAQAQQEQHEAEHREHQERARHQQQQQAAVQHLMAGENNGAFLHALRAAAAAPGGAPGHFGGGGRPEESAILQLVEERERQRRMAAIHHQQQQSPFLPDGVASSAPPGSPMQLELQQRLQQHLQAQQQQQQQRGLPQDERAELIAKVAAAAASASNHHHPGFLNESSAAAAAAALQQQQAIPSKVLSALAAVEEAETHKILQMQKIHQENQPSSFRSSGVMMNGLSPQELAHHRRQQHEQQQQQQAAAAAAVLAEQQQRQPKEPAVPSKKEEPEQQPQQHHPTVEEDASFHDSKSTILPCRARGMPMDHNVKTAYFVIPQKIKHGTELLCSYFACRNAGIKFRYCVYCKLPVAKRNFAKRHRHLGKIPESELSRDLVPSSGVPDTCILIDSNPDDTPASSSDPATPQPTEDSEKIGEEESKSQEKNLSDDDSMKPSAPESVTVSTLPSELGENSKDVKDKIVSSSCIDDRDTPSCNVVSCEEASTNMTDPPELAQTSETKANGADANPRKSDEMAPKRVSDPTVCSPKPTFDANKRRKAWGRLLMKRPKSEHHNSDAMAAWIQDVLRVSDFEKEIVSDVDDADADDPTDKLHTPNGGTKRKGDETRSPPAKKSKTKALLSRKVQEEMEEMKGTIGSNGVENGRLQEEKDKNVPGMDDIEEIKEETDSNSESSSIDQDDDEDKGVSGESLAETSSGKADADVPDDASTSSEESVDLRIRKKSRT